VGVEEILGWVRETSLLRVWGPNAAISRLASLRLTRQFKGLNEGPIWKMFPPPPFFSLILTPHTRLSCVCTHTPPHPQAMNVIFLYSLYSILALSNINLDKSFVRYGVKEVYKEFDPHIFSVISIFYP